METMKTEYPINAMAEALEVSKSGFFAHRRKEEAPRRQEDREIVRAIQPIFAASRQTYGCLRLRAALRQGGRRCGKNRVARLMRFELPAPQAETAARAASHHGQQASRAGGRELAGQGARAGSARSGVGGRHHLHRHGRGLAVSGWHSRCLHAPLRGLADGRNHGGNAGDPSMAEKRCVSVGQRRDWCTIQTGAASMPAGRWPRSWPKAARQPP
jgi:hypothetical protein